MGNVEVHTTHEMGSTSSSERVNKEVVAGSSFAEGVVGLGAVILSILGIVGILPLELAAISTILLGAALVLESGAIAVRYYRVHERTGLEPPEEVAGGLRAESLAGIGAIVLGVLALIRVDPLVLLPV